ncbi:high-affinity Fe2+/Pb2+ permease [Streptococcus pneumoniae]|nr:high-affinity Fe2+/Pb2+ permease [Streptococcus pneumoniae]
MKLVSVESVNWDLVGLKKMNSTWTINESMVRDNSTAHYGRVETAISFLPSSMETEPTDESGT